MRSWIDVDDPTPPGRVPPTFIVFGEPAAPFGRVRLNDAAVPHARVIQANLHDLAAGDHPEAAEWVLRMGCGDRFPEPGSFFKALTDAAFKADGSNLELLRNAFPDVAAALWIYKNVSGSPAILREFAAAFEKYERSGR